MSRESSLAINRQKWIICILPPITVSILQICPSRRVNFVDHEWPTTRFVLEFRENSEMLITRRCMVWRGRRWLVRIAEDMYRGRSRKLSDSLKNGADVDI